MTTTIQVRVDNDLKEKADLLFKELGTDTTTAIRMFLTQAILTEGFPFDIKKHSSEPIPYKPLLEEEILLALEESRKKGGYRVAENVSDELRKKYGL